MTQATEEFYEDEAERAVEATPLPVPTDDDLASVAHKRHNLSGIIARIARPFDEEIAALEADLAQLRQDREDALRTWQASQARYDMALEAYMRERSAQTGEKSLKLPYMTLQLRRSPDRVDVADDAVDALPEWAVRVTRAANKPEIMRRLKETGEVPDGVSVVPGEVRFSIKDTE